MTEEENNFIKAAEQAALEVLLHNEHGPFAGLPRTAGWGYPEPYTRDLSISALGIAVSKNSVLVASMRKVLVTMAENQAWTGQISSLVHDNRNLGSSDTTPCFLMAVGVFRRVLEDPQFLEEAVEKAIVWMQYQCPTSHYLIAQQPTSDWRDEQWVLGYGLFVNSLTYLAYKLLGKEELARNLGKAINQLTFASDAQQVSPHEGLAINNKPYYALWSYKVYSSERFDLLGNSLAIIAGLATPSKGKQIVEWIEDECVSLRKKEILAVNIAPNLFPYIQPEDADWLPRYSKFNLPGEYHNGGIWPFISGFYIVALIANQQYELAEKQLLALAHLVKKGRNGSLNFGFNEWYKAQTGKPMGQDWQTWSASNFLYAAKCVREKRTLFLDIIKKP